VAITVFLLWVPAGDPCAAGVVDLDAPTSDVEGRTVTDRWAFDTAFIGRKARGRNRKPRRRSHRYPMAPKAPRPQFA